MLNKKAIAAFAAASIVASCGFCSFAFASEVSNNTSDTAPVTTPTVNPEIPNNSDNGQQNPDETSNPTVDTAKDDAEFEAALDEAYKKAENAELMKWLAEGAVKALQEKVDKATTDADKTKLQEQLKNAQKIAAALDELNNKAKSMVKAYSEAAQTRKYVKAFEAMVAESQAKLDKLAKNSKEYDNAAKELKELQKQLESGQKSFQENIEGITKVKEELVEQGKQTKELQQEHETPEHKNPEVAPEHKNPEHETPEHKTPEHENPEVAPEHKNPAPKPVTPVTPHRDNPSVTPSVTPSDDTPSVTTPSADVPSATTPSSAPASTPAATTPHAGIPAAPASVADLLPGLKGMLTVGANNVAVAGAVNRVTLNISNNQTVIDWLNSNHRDRAYAFIYSSPRLLKGVNGADYMTVTRTANGKLQFDVMFPAGYSGKHTVVFVDDQGNQLGWTNITVANGTATQGEGLPKTGVGIALIVLTASVLAGAGAAFRKIRR